MTAMSKRVSDLLPAIETIERTLGHFATCIRQAGSWSLALAQGQNDARVAIAAIRKEVEAAIDRQEALRKAGEARDRAVEERGASDGEQSAAEKLNRRPAKS